MPREPDPPLHRAADAALALLVARYDVVVDEDPRRADALDEPPAPGFVRLARLVPRGTDGESLTVVLTAAGGVTAHVRRSRVLTRPAGSPAHDLTARLVALAEDLAWAPRLPAD